MAIDANTTAQALMLGGLVTLNGKIVYDWLRNRRNGTNGAPPGCHEKHSQIDSRLAVIDEKIQQNADDLDRGNEKFAEIATTLTDMNKSIGILLDRADRRRSTDE